MDDWKTTYTMYSALALAVCGALLRWAYKAVVNDVTTSNNKAKVDETSSKQISNNDRLIELSTRVSHAESDIDSIKQSVSQCVNATDCIKDQTTLKEIHAKDLEFRTEQTKILLGAMEDRHVIQMKALQGSIDNVAKQMDRYLAISLEEKVNTKNFQKNLLKAMAKVE